MELRLPHRDLEIFTALNRCPLTARQLFKLSETFALPFTDEHRVRERLLLLATSGRVRRWPYATAGRGAPNYYKLSRLGYRLLCGDEASPPSKRAFSRVGISRQHHTRALADFIVHTAVLAHRAGICFDGFCRENSVRLAAGDDSVFPDCAFQLLPGDGREFSFFVELDNSTERIHTEKDVESWQRKLRVYDRFQRRCGRRFRVLIVTTRSQLRLDHLLAAAAEVLQNDSRSLFYGIHLDDFLRLTDGLRSACFRDHNGRGQALVPGTLKNDQAPSAIVTVPAPC